MKAYIRHIGIIDIKGNTHSVSFNEGVNIITGKSSTGKSALLDIFDYCFGSSEFTPPKHGVIYEFSEIYFVVINLERSSLVLARKKDTKKAFLKEELESLPEDIENINKEYFQDNYFTLLKIFKINLGRYLGLTLTNVDESNEEKFYRPDNRKLPSPSIRSITSFMLQQQNLIANKFALFYRFEQKEKKDQALEHFKYFAGFVDPHYYTLKQQEDELSSQIRSIELLLKRVHSQEQQLEAEVKDLLCQYKATSGNELFFGNVSDFVAQPSRSLSYLASVPVQTDGTSDEHSKLFEETRRTLSNQIAKLRKVQNQSSDVDASIRLSKYHLESGTPHHLPESIELNHLHCPFCDSSTSNLVQSANSLSEAILWLNTKLAQSHFMQDSFEEKSEELRKEIIEIKAEIKTTEESLHKLDKDTKDLEKSKTQYELAVKIKVKVEILLEKAAENEQEMLEEELNVLKNKIQGIRKLLTEQYNINQKKLQAESYIKNAMSKIGSKFDFEPFYQPINLKFSLDSFDLWHEGEDGRKIFLRSMGSGANWLYSHLTLFLALHQYFCSLKNACRVPSILFLDQPSQVYFPRTDHGEKFNAAKLVEQTNENVSDNIDGDLKAVQNMYTQFVNFCDNTFLETGIMPQLIITDHADNLELAKNISFEELVKARWRNRGLIDESKTNG